MNRKEIEQLKKDAEIPEIVWDKAREAYRQIESGQVEQIRKQTAVKKIILRTLSTAAACIVLVLLVCIYHPVMAEKVPLLGNLFSRLQDKVSFKGDFDEEAINLTEDLEKEEITYTKEASGMKITLSEVYANDIALYITVIMESEKPFPEQIRRDSETEMPILMMMREMNYDFMESMNGSPQIMYPEGFFVDDHTYTCICRFPLELYDEREYLEKYDEMTQNVLDEMGITSDDMLGESDEAYGYLEEFNDKVLERRGALEKYRKQIAIPEKFTAYLDIDFMEFYLEPTAEEERPIHSYDGDWSFEIPVELDRSKTIIMDINETNEAGIGLQKVVKTPYEITVHELYAEGSDSDTFMVALDALGNRLPYNRSEPDTNCFAIQDRDVSKIDIFILDYITYMDELKGVDWYNGNEERSEDEKWSTLLKQYAKYHKTIEFE